jgi:hypothetical protein
LFANTNRADHLHRCNRTTLLYIYFNYRQFIPVNELVALRAVSSHWKHFIDTSNEIWKQKLSFFFPIAYSVWSTQTTDFYQRFVLIHKETCNCWDTSFINGTGSFKDNDRTAVHGFGAHFFPVKAKKGNNVTNISLKLRLYQRNSLLGSYSSELR